MEVMVTKHAVAERLDLDVIQQQVSYIEKMPFLKQAFNMTTVMVLIMNKYRQIIFANNAFLKMMGFTEEKELWGKRPGEILQCEHARDNMHGCGTSEACRYCNVTNLILTAMEENIEADGESAISRTVNGFSQTLNLLENIAPLYIGDEVYYVASFIDASDTIKKRIMERIFFHDVINTAGALRGIIELLENEVPEEIKPEMVFVEKAFDYMVEEIRAQKQLIEAENNELVTKLDTIESGEILSYIIGLYENHQLAKNKTIRLAENSSVFTFVSDGLLLKRVLGNMLKNALEASRSGDMVTIGASYPVGQDKKIKFWVHNSQFMPQNIQLKLFQRSFSTKGSGRGLGTYSMKLLGEKYLGGKIGFETDPETGTTFYILLDRK